MTEVLYEEEVWSLYLCKNYLYARGKHRNEYGRFIKDIEIWFRQVKDSKDPKIHKKYVLMKQAYQAYQENFS